MASEGDKNVVPFDSSREDVHTGPIAAMLDDVIASEVRIIIV